jgi:hypothetical protein
MEKEKVTIEKIFQMAQLIKDGKYVRKKQKRNGKLRYENPEVVFDKVKKTEADLFLKRHDVNIKGFVRTMNLEQITHVLNRHPNMTISDFLIAILIINEYDVCGLGKHPNTIVYKKTLANDFFYIEFIQGKNRKLALNTFYKRKKR